MQNGKVKYYNAEKGYGFITAEDGQDYFFHISGLTAKWGSRSPEKDDKVTFEVVEGNRGPKAINVELVDGTAEGQE